MNLNESLDKIYPITELRPKVSWIYAEWEFEAGSQTHVIRINKLKDKLYGKRVSKFLFGIRRGKQVRSKLTGITDIRQYIATIIAAIEKAYDHPNTKLKTKSDGFVITMDTEVFEARGEIFKRILKMKLRKKFKMHNSYHEVPDMEDTKGIYIWKKERSFKTVFSNINVEDDSEDEKILSAPTKVVVKNKVKDVLKTKLEPVAPVVKKTEPVITQQLSKKEVEVSLPSQKVVEAKKAGGKDMAKRKPNLESYVALVVLSNFFKKSFGSGYATDTSLDISSAKKFSADEIENFIAYKMDVLDKSNLPSNEEAMIALNLRGIQTNDIYDLHKKPFNMSSYTKKKFEDMNIDPVAVLDILFPKRNNVQLNEIVDIVINARSVLKEYGINSTGPGPNVSERDKTINSNKTLNSLIEDFSEDSFGKKEIFALANNIMSSIDPSELDNYSPYETRTSSKGKKKYRSFSYGNKSKKIDALHSLTHLAEMKLEGKDYIELIDNLPYYMQGMYSEDTELFETKFMHNWTLSGSSFAQVVANKTISDFGVNGDLNDFYVDVDRRPQGEKEIESIEARKEIIKDHFEKMYEKSQEFFREKFKKKYETKTITLYRGVGINVVDTYIPGALESWSTSVAVAKSFGAMMAKGKQPYTILTAEVPIQHIFGSYESFYDTFPGEEDLKGKKEYIVMGGTFATTPIHIYDISAKEKKDTVKTFKEWFEINEGKNMKKDAIKITTPSMKTFEKALKSGKAALGNDPRESEARKSETVSKNKK